MKFRKFLTIGIAALSVAAFSFGLAACKPDTEDPGKDPVTPGGDTPVTPAEVTVEGGYGIYFADQGGLGLEVNLYEDGTYYFSQFTSNIVYGEYTAEAATGTDSDGRTIHYTVTFDESVNFGEGPHNIVSDSEGAVYLTGMYDDMSNATYSFTKQDDFIVKKSCRRSNSSGASTMPPTSSPRHSIRMRPMHSMASTAQAWLVRLVLIRPKPQRTVPSPIR